MLTQCTMGNANLWDWPKYLAQACKVYILWKPWPRPFWFWLSLLMTGFLCECPKLLIENQDQAHLKQCSEQHVLQKKYGATRCVCLELELELDNASAQHVLFLKKNTEKKKRRQKLFVPSSSTDATVPSSSTDATRCTSVCLPPRLLDSLMHYWRIDSSQMGPSRFDQIRAARWGGKTFK